ncbi:MAG: helix-turn-helix domain-containing protein [Acidobacteria bacterium]|nr:helix-turn-helix domain-containing protein [Acidobacteriota bacterium]
MLKREKFLRTAEVARALHVSPKTVARWAKEGRLPYLATLGGHRRFPESRITEIVDTLSREVVELVTTKVDFHTSGY